MGFLDVGGLRNNNRGMEIAKIILEIAVTFPQLFKHSNIPACRSTKESARAKESSYPSPLLSYGTDIARKREDAKERTVLVRASSIHRIFPVDVSFSWNGTERITFSLLLEKCFLEDTWSLLTLTLTLRGGKDGKIGRKRRVESN